GKGSKVKFAECDKASAEENQKAQQNDRTSGQSECQYRLQHRCPLNPPCLAARARGSARCGGQSIAQEQCAFGGDQLTRLDALEDLPVAVLLQADFDCAFGETAPVGGDP